MSTINSVRPTLRNSAIGIAVAATLVVATGLLAALVIGVMVATGTLQHTSQGWVFRGPVSGSDLTTANQNYDPKIYTLLRESGTGASTTSAITATSSWSVSWAFACPNAEGRIQVVAHSAAGASYAAGALSGSSQGAGQSNVIPPGTYTLSIATDQGCPWSIGARPNH